MCCAGRRRMNGRIADIRCQSSMFSPLLHIRIIYALLTHHHECGASIKRHWNRTIDFFFLGRYILCAFASRNAYPEPVCGIQYTIWTWIFDGEFYKIHNKNEKGTIEHSSDVSLRSFITPGCAHAPRGFMYTWKWLVGLQATSMHRITIADTRFLSFHSETISE